MRLGDLSLRIICVRGFALFARFARCCFVKSEEVIIVSCRKPRANTGQIVAFNFVHGPKQMRQGKRNTIYTIYSNPICADKTGAGIRRFLHPVFAKVGLKPILLSEKNTADMWRAAQTWQMMGATQPRVVSTLIYFLYLSGIKLARWRGHSRGMRHSRLTF